MGCLLAPAASAQILSGGGTLLSEIAPKWHMGVSVDAFGEFALPADASNAFGGDVGVYTSGVNVKGQMVWDASHFLTLSLDYAYDYFDFSSDAAPFSSMNRTAMMLFYTGRIDERWGVFAAANFRLGAQTGESLWDARQFAGGAGVTYMFAENLTVGLGGMGYSRLDYGWSALPMVFVDWQITERLRLRTFGGGALFYDVFGDSSLVLAFSVEYRNLYYRLEQDPLGRERSVRDNYIQLSAGATFNFSKNAYVSASVGASLNRDFQMRTNKSRAERIEVDAAPMFTLHAGWRF